MSKTLSNADFRSYQTLAPFESIDDLNYTIRIHLYENKHELTESAVQVFKLIACHAIKAPGVAFLKYDVIAGQIGISVSTVKRSIGALKDRNMIEVHRTTRLRGKRRGGYGHNVFVIVDPSTERSKMNDREKRPNLETASDQPGKKDAEALSLESSTLSEEKTKHRYTRKETVADKLDASYVPAHVPRAFVTAAKPFFNANDTYKLWGRAVRAYKRMNIEANLMDENVVQMLVQAFKGAMFMDKTDRLRGSVAGYFYGACVRIFDDIFSEELEELRQKFGREDQADDVPGWLADG